jgi:hypothetical protein
MQSAPLINTPWGDKCLATQAAPRAALQQGVRQSGSAGQFRYADALAAVLDDIIVCRVVALFKGCCPPTVARFVVSVIVNTIKRAPSRPRSHVCVKVLKGTPPLAHRDSSSAVTGKVSGLRICAALNHRSPHDVLGTSEHPMRTVRVPLYLVKAAARLRSSAGQVDGINNGCGATVAEALPCRGRPRGRPLPIGSASDHRQHPKSLSGSINEFWHN